MSPDASNQFLDVPALLETSQPQPRVPWLWFVAGGCIVAMASAALAGNGAGGVVAQVFAWILSLVIFVGMPVMLRVSLGQLRSEQLRVQGVAELVQLRHWPSAALSLQQILSRPARTPQIRTESLIYLATVLSRYHRFNDAIAVHNHLLESELVAPGTAYGLKLARSMAMLREDHLFDADRAISDLRRSGPSDSAATLLIEIYRDVKTGHPLDALRVFEGKLPLLRDQLGHRVADLYALAARAYDLLDRQTEAADAFHKATLLAPVAELCRRYPEVQKLLGRYEPSAAPFEMI